jgi:hypothetical protein
MNIALDFDDTYTRDPTLWNEFVRMCQYRGHTVKIVTARSSDKNECAEVEAVGQMLDINVICTSGKQKRVFWPNCHVWIDDCPQAIPASLPGNDLFSVG